MSPKSQNPKNNIYLIDGSGFIFRAYYALPPLTRSDGLPVGAVSGFCNMIYKLLTNKLNDAISALTPVVCNAVPIGIIAANITIIGQSIFL